MGICDGEAQGLWRSPNKVEYGANKIKKGFKKTLSNYANTLLHKWFERWKKVKD